MPLTDAISFDVACSYLVVSMLTVDLQSGVNTALVNDYIMSLNYNSLVDKGIFFHKVIYST